MKRAAFWRYARDQKSWLAFFLAALGAVDLLLWIDNELRIAPGPLLYMNGLLLFAFALFLWWRFMKETAFAQQLVALEALEDWEEALPAPVYARDEAVWRALHRVALAHRERLASAAEARVLEGDYTAAWVHEVKAPLTAMKLALDAHRGEPLARSIEAEWFRIDLLIDRQLFISRLPTLESDYVLERVDAQALAASEVQALGLWCREKNLSVEIEGAEQSVLTDRKWCRFVLRQLLTNAVKYSPAGGAISIEIRAEDGGRTALWICDEGPGIPPHDLPRIFDKGFTGGAGRLHNAATGLGLYLARLVARRIGLSIDAFSEPGAGARMRVLFPLENDFDTTRR